MVDAVPASQTRRRGAGCCHHRTLFNTQKCSACHTHLNVSKVPRAIVGGGSTRVRDATSGALRFNVLPRSKCRVVQGAWQGSVVYASASSLNLQHRHGPLSIQKHNPTTARSRVPHKQAAAHTIQAHWLMTLTTCSAEKMPNWTRLIG